MSLSSGQTLAGTVAIETKFHGPTNYRDARYSAVCCNCEGHVRNSGRVYVNSDTDLEPHENAQRAAVKHYETHHGRNGKYYARVSESGHGIRMGWAFPLIAV